MKDEGLYCDKRKEYCKKLQESRYSGFTGLNQEENQYESEARVTERQRVGRPQRLLLNLKQWRTVK